MTLVMLLSLIISAAGILLWLAAGRQGRNAKPQEAETFLPPLRPRAQREPVTIIPRQGRKEDILTIVPRHKTRPVIRRAPRPVWQEYGWHQRKAKDTVIYSGEYRINDLRTATTQVFKGALRVRGNQIDGSVQDIPPELYQSTINGHPKRYCFRLIDPAGSGSPPLWFRIDWETSPKDPDSALLYIEHILSEAINHSW
jgi:hypothetical protein